MDSSSLPPSPPTTHQSSYILNIYLDESLDEKIKNWYIHYKTKYDGDSGIDLVCPENVVFSGLNTVETIDFKIKTSLFNTKTNQYSSYYLYPRSSISNTPLILANSVGIIDSGYRGNLMAKVRHVPIQNQELLEHVSYEVSEGTSLFQICSPHLKTIKINIVSSIEDLGKSNRGENGFGSSGKNIDAGGAAEGDFSPTGGCHFNEGFVDDEEDEFFLPPQI